MKRSLMVFTAIASFALPALAPVATLAQDRQAQTEDSPRAQRRAERGDQAASPQQRRDEARASRPERPQTSPDS